MRKVFSISVLGILVGLMACTKVEDSSAPVSISYTVGRYAYATKASSFLDTTDDNFRSLATLHVNGAAVGMEFYNTTISWDETSHTWGPDRDYFWPKSPSSYINFVSWYANDGTNAIVPGTVSETSFIVTRTIGADDSILLADEAWRFKDNNFLPHYNFNSVSSGVPTLFRQMLSRVCIKISADPLEDEDDDTVTYEVTLNNLYLDGIYRTGTMTMVNSDPGTTGTVAWTPSTPGNDIYWSAADGTNDTPFVIVSSDTNITGTPSAVLAERSIMPQILNSEAILTAEYSITTKKNGNVIFREDSIISEITLNSVKNRSDENIVKWVPNKKYTYNLTINPVNAKILLNPTLEESWNVDQNQIMSVE
ncbi:MAG: fimbrillin family protein [Bacteroidales bacterium]|nr:fimbrillin family protein [Bacteroidales bacterium]